MLSNDTKFLNPIFMHRALTGHRISWIFSLFMDFCSELSRRGGGGVQLPSKWTAGQQRTYPFPLPIPKGSICAHLHWKMEAHTPLVVKAFCVCCPRGPHRLWAVLGNGHASSAAVVKCSRRNWLVRDTGCGQWKWPMARRVWKGFLVGISDLVQMQKGHTIKVALNFWLRDVFPSWYHSFHSSYANDFVKFTRSSNNNFLIEIKTI